MACSILGMHKDQRRAIEIGARKFKQGGVLNRGFFGLLSAPAATWESITEAEIGKDWVQFLIGIFLIVRERKRERASERERECLCVCV